MIVVREPCLCCNHVKRHMSCQPKAAVRSVHEMSISVSLSDVDISESLTVCIYPILAIRPWGLVEELI